MDFNLNQKDQEKIRLTVLRIIQNTIQEIEDNSCPYLNRKDIAKYFGVAESTISYWGSLGMPIANINGRKLYGKKSITHWLEDHEKYGDKTSIKKPQLYW